MARTRFGRILDRVVPHHEESLGFRVGVNVMAMLERVVPGLAWDPTAAEIVSTEEELRMDGQQIMQSWEEPVMRVLAESVAASNGDVLEIGFGMGISAGHVVRAGCRSFTVMEANPGVRERIRSWAETHHTPVVIVAGPWQNNIDSLGSYDGILFDTYPRTFRERTAGQRFRDLERLSAHLRPGGVLAPFTRYFSRLPRSHLRALRRLFEEVSIRRVAGLAPPAGCDYWRSTSMLCLAGRTSATPASATPLPATSGPIRRP